MYQVACDTEAMRRSERLLRGAVVACLSTAVALAMHVAGGGAMPTAIGVAVPLGLTLGAGAHLASTPLSRWRLAAAVVAAQVLFHGAFALGRDAHASHAAHAQVTPSMLLAHAAAALATYAVLRRADVLVALIRRATVSLVRRLTRVPPRPVLSHRASPILPDHAPRAIGIARCTRGLRGPPLCLA